MFPIVETERLILREIIDEDATDLFRCFSNHLVTQYYGLEPFATIEEAEKLIETFSENYKEKRGIRWGIERKEVKGIIGTIGFNAWSPKHKRAEIGYELHPDFWRKGYTKEAVAEIVAFGFEKMELNRIGAIVFIENVASNQLLTHLGFRKEGVLKEYMYQQGKAHDTNVYAIFNDKL
ncbi:GNAT family N-acetyltransferase [Lysinibacillus mangiferihumi]|uniref:GNAT family N-acetyltransferase n=1 Tax=Lysinibacillus mangiferihumi TaxID=1130819 RepID=A0A4U2Z8M1_9BACI|nr:GNAT family protein [Lysinibacillus mangiferihumi]TKI70648.1 GNAT family N-acetyltransferase [Lysinibacillus mangiferihumi]